MIHILKLCVGATCVEDLKLWQDQRRSELARTADPFGLMHVTRQTPRRRGFQVGSSIYWVIGGFIRARQVITALHEVPCADGITRCGLALGEELVLTIPVPRRPFQGWRYLMIDDAPRDLDVMEASCANQMPPSMRASLCELGLL